jgi:cystathionine beta-lyase
MGKPPRDGQDEATRLIRAGAGARSLKATTVAPPVQRGSTVLLDRADQLYDPRYVTYGRNGLIGHEALLEALCELEAAERVFLYGSGLAALTGAIASLVSAGDEVLCVDCVYSPTRRYLDSTARRFGVTTRYFGPRATADEVAAMIGPATRLILLETPGSLTFEMQDVAAVAAAARARGVVTLLDNTYGAGVLFRPLEHGVDVSVQALTKYVGGHSDVFMGSAAVRSPEVAKQLAVGMRDHGWTVSPDDAYQVLRGIRTLAPRVDRAGASGLEVARWLETQPEVARLIHPGLENHPDHAIWRRDFKGANGLFSLILQPAPETAVNAFLDALELFGLGFSWGGFESLAIPCDIQLKTARTAEPWRAEGPLVRLHVGLEDPADLIADLRRGLDAFDAAARA